MKHLLNRLRVIKTNVLKTVKQDDDKHQRYLIETHGINSHATRKNRSTSSIRQINTKHHRSPTREEHPFPFLSFNTEPTTRKLYNEKNVRRLVDQIRKEIGELVDEDFERKAKKTVPLNSDANQNLNCLSRNKSRKAHRSKRKAKSVKKKKTIEKPKKLKVTPKRKRKKKKRKKVKSKKKHTHPIEKKIPVIIHEPSGEISIPPTTNCCCNFLHYSLRQVMRDTEQMKQFALNTSMIGVDPLKLRDPTNTLCSAVCIPMYNCENIADQRFPSGPTFTTVTKTELTQSDHPSTSTQTRSMVIQTIDTQHGPIQIKLDPQSFGLAPFFSDQYETFIKGPSNSIFFTTYLNTYQDNLRSI